MLKQIVFPEGRPHKISDTIWRKIRAMRRRDPATDDSFETLLREYHDLVDLELAGALLPGQAARLAAALDALDARDPNERQTDARMQETSDSLSAILAELQSRPRRIVTAADETGLLSYLKTATLAGDITEVTAEAAWWAWQRIQQVTHGMMPPPDAATGPDGQLLLGWNTERYHAELEFMQDATAEWFTRDRETGDLWSESYERDAPLTMSLQNTLTLFV